MARLCAWCEETLWSDGFLRLPVSHTICSGCLEDLTVALRASGLKTEQPAASDR